MSKQPGSGEITHAAMAAFVTQVDKWQQRTEQEPREVQDGSVLAMDDAATAYVQTSHMVNTALAYSVDHLHAVRMLVVKAEVLHMGALFTLLRSALENASVAVWLLSPEERRERVRRRLWLAMADVKNSDDVARLVDMAGPRTLEERQRDLLDIAGRASIGATEIRQRGPGFEKIVQTAGAHLGAERLYVMQWKSMSGVAHGRQWALLSILNTEPYGRAGEGVQNVRVTSNLSTLASAAHFSAEMTREAWRLYDTKRLFWRDSANPP